MCLRYGVLIALSCLLHFSACRGKKDLSNLQFRIFFPDVDDDIRFDHPPAAPGLRQVIRYQGGRPMDIVAYNRQGQVVFHHQKQYVGDFWPGGYITMITGYVYEGERMSRVYELHSNAGFKIKDYSYPWLGWQVQEYARRNTCDPETELKNHNRFRYIEAITSWKQLVEHPKIQELETRGVKRLLNTRTFGLDSRLDRDVYQEGSEPIWEARLVYNSQQQPVQQRATRGGKLDQVITLAYDKNGRLSQALETGPAGDTAQWHVYRYNARGQVHTRFELRDPPEASTAGGARYHFLKLAFQYTPQGNVSKCTASDLVVKKECGFSCPGQLLEERAYQYNAQGYILEEQTCDATAEKCTTNRYHYSYSYY